MSAETQVQSPSLEAKSPFELRVNLATGYSESVIKKALASGDMGFLHSFTTGSTVDGPGVRLVAWTAGRSSRHATRNGFLSTDHLESIRGGEHDGVPHRRQRSA